MRDIIFRGKRTDNGEWVEGYYSLRKGKPVIYSGKIQVKDGGHYIGHGLYEEISRDEFFGVVKETVCEWTGLTDKNGKKIFEGDILAQPEYPDETCLVIYKNGHFAIRGLWDAVLCDYNNKVEVIGNIYDNLDLIER